MLTWLNVNFTIDQIDTDHLDFGSPERKFEFPTFINPLDDLVLSEPLIIAAQKLLGTKDIRLIQADLWPKIGVTDDNHEAQANTDQRMHMDYGNNSLLHPQWDAPDAVAAVIYYDDFNETGGGTGYVPRRGIDDPVYQPPYVNMPGQAGNPFFNDRTTVENWFEQNDPKIYELRQQLYKREEVVKFKPGTILFDTKKQFNARVMVDGSIKCKESEGSIHKVAAKIMGTESYNGWTYWHCNIDGSTVLIDNLRQKFLSQKRI